MGVLQKGLTHSSAGRARAAGIREVVLKPDTADELGTILDRMFRCG